MRGGFTGCDLARSGRSESISDGDQSFSEAETWRRETHEGLQKKGSILARGELVESLRRGSLERRVEAGNDVEKALGVASLTVVEHVHGS